MGGMPGTTSPNKYGSPVYCTKVGPDGHLYVAGAFTVCGDVLSHGVAKWDGNQWISISPPDTDSYDVRAMAFDAQGHLIVGGRFRRFGGKDTLRIARWDGQEWHAMGDGLGFDGTFSSQLVSAIALSPSGELYAAGKFDSSGATTINNIARWDGSEWHPLDTGLEDSGIQVNDMVFDGDGNLYVTGHFGWAGGIPVDHVAKWNGSNWSAMGNGLSGPNGDTGSDLIIDSSGDIVVCGLFRYAGNAKVNNIAKWNGTAWSAFGPAGTSAGIDGGSFGIKRMIESPQGDLIAAGKMSIVDGKVLYTLVRWNGTNWLADVLPQSAVGGEIHDLTYLPNNQLVLGGAFDAFGTGSNAFHASNLIRWSGSDFYRYGNGSDGIVRSIIFDDNGHMIVGGNFNTIGGIEASGIARFDGTNWWSYGDGLWGGNNPGVHALALGSNGALYAGGMFEHAGSVDSKSVAYWDGEKWISMDGGLSLTSTQPIVRSMVIGLDGSLFVGGSFASSDSFPSAFSGIARWHQGAWHGLDDDGGSGGGSVMKLALEADGDLIAVGSFSKIGASSTGTDRIARWDGVAWYSVGTTVADNRPLTCLALDSNGDIYVGADTYSAYESVFRLLPSGQWWNLNGFNGEPKDLAFTPDGKLLVCGDLTNTNPNNDWNLLRGVGIWNGSYWESLGNEGLGMFSTHDQVHTIAQDGKGNLVFGGNFAGSKSGVVSPFLIRTRTDDYGLWPTLRDLPVAQLSPTDNNGPLNLNNLLAYAMGVNPMDAKLSDLPSIKINESAAEARPVMGEGLSAAMAAPGGSVMKYRYRRNRVAGGIITQVMASADLLNWIPATVTDTAILEQYSDWERVEVTIPADATKKFLRLEVEFDDKF